MLQLLPLVPLITLQGPSLEEQYDALAGIDRATPESRVAEVATPSVVFVETEYTQKGRNLIWGDWERTYQGSGSGVVVHSDGYIVTNYHVVKGSQRIQVSFAGDPASKIAQVVSFSRADDLALLKTLEEGPYPTVRMGTSSDLMPGERVVAIGNPHGQMHTVSTGIISGLHRNLQIPGQNLAFEDLIQTDASINQGNSGGPLLNIRGELIGINTAMNTQAENIGFAIPVDRVRENLTSILYPQAKRSWLGFEPAAGEPLVVRTVWPDGPAADAGICEGDRIVAVGGTPVSNHDEFRDATLRLEPRERVELAFDRGGRRNRVQLDSWDRVDGLLFERLGMTVRERAVEHSRWLFVDRLSAGGPAERLGLQQDDLIPAIRPHIGRFDTWRVNSRENLARIVQNLEPGTQIDVDIYRDLDDDRAYTRQELHKGSLEVR